MSRKDEKDADALYFQMDRFMQQNDEWFYTTREGEERGPFKSKHEAEEDLVAFLKSLI